MRLFVAIDLDEAARSAIAREQKRIASAIGRDNADKALTWVAADRMHLTLVFLGEVADAAAPAIVEAVGRDVAQVPFDAVLGGVGVFPPDTSRKPPRVLWLGVGEGAAAIVSVQREMASRVSALGQGLDDRPFHPHLTLARWRRSVWSDRRRVDAAAGPHAIARMCVDHVTLYRSLLSSAGPSYTPLARANLLRS